MIKIISLLKYIIIMFKRQAHNQNFSRGCYISGIVNYTNEVGPSDCKLL